MAINTQKFLPSSKETRVSTTFSNKSSLVPLSRTSIKNIGVIRVKVVEIDKILKGTLAVQKKDLDSKKREISSKRREKIEEKLETKPNAESGKIEMPSLPRMGFLDWVKNFIGNIILGYFAVRLVDQLPKIIPIIKFLGKATDFVLDVGGKLLDGLVTFIDWGYKAYDATRGFVKNLFGESGAKQFDQLSSLLNKFLNLALIAGMAAAGSGGFGGGRPRGGGARPGTGGRPKVTTSGGGRAGEIDLRNPLRERPKITTGAGEVVEVEAKTLLGSARPFLKRIPLPVIGALIDFGLSWALGENPGRAAFRAIGASILGAIGGGLAGALGLAGGPLAVATAALGSIAGGTLGDMAGGALYDLFFGGKKPKSSTKKMAGGGITRGGKAQGRVRRSIGGGKKKRKYKRALTPKKPGEVETTSPGSDVGGQDKLFGIFPNPFKKVVDTYNPFKNVSSAQKNLGDSDYFGPIMAITSKIILGQKPSQKDYENVGLGINMLFSEGLNKGKLKGGLIAAFAEGGFVDPQAISAVTDSGDISNWVAKSFKDATDTNAQKTLKEIQENLRLKKDKEVTPSLEKKDPSTDPSLDIGPGGTVTGGNADFWTLVAIASREDGDPQGSADVAQSIYNRVASGVYGAKTIKGIVTSNNQYEPTWKYPRFGKTGTPNPEWFNIKDAASAAAATGMSISAMNSVAAALRNKKYQDEAARFVGGRTDFMGGGNQPGPGDIRRKENAPNNFFGWFVGPAAKAYGAKNPGPAKAPQLGDIVVMGGGGGDVLGTKGGNLQTAKKIAESMGLIMTSYKRGPRYPGDNSLHIQGRAMDFSNTTGNTGTPQQLNYAKKMVSDYGSSLTQLIYTPLGYGIANRKKVGLDYWGAATNKEHYNHVHVAYAKGGFTPDGPTQALVGERGKEFVIDADSTQAIEETFPGFLGALNNAKYMEAINVLRNFASYESDAPETIFVPLPEISQPDMGEGEYSGGGMFMGGGEEDTDPFESLYMGG